ncbi:MAG: hypothetical protein IJT73_02435 [Selenomonadaceae bacterium]|nr:hypothetical protein [Selenomonadaceae bacterium]
MQMLRLNIRHELPQITIRNHHGKLDKNAYVPAQVHTEDQQARSNKTVSQPSIQMDSYQSRRDYGARNLTDLTREFGQKGLSDVQTNRSRTTQIAWERAENGGKPGDDIKQQYKNQIHAEEPETLVEFDLMEGLQIYYTPAQVIGESELGDVTAEIETEPFADVHFKPGNLNVYLQNEGFIRRWVTMNEYDIYA